MESDQHPDCSISTYFKMQKGTFLPQTFKPFPDGPRLVSEWEEPSEAGSHRDGGPGLVVSGYEGASLYL